MFFFSDDSSILCKAQLEFVSDAKNAHLFPEKEDDPQPQRDEKAEAGANQEETIKRIQRAKEQEKEGARTGMYKATFLHESTKRKKRYKQLLWKLVGSCDRHIYQSK